MFEKLITRIRKFLVPDPGNYGWVGQPTVGRFAGEIGRMHIIVPCDAGISRVSIDVRVYPDHVRFYNQGRKVVGLRRCLPLIEKYLKSLDPNAEVSFFPTRSVLDITVSPETLHENPGLIGDATSILSIEEIRFEDAKTKTWSVPEGFAETKEAIRVAESDRELAMRQPATLFSSMPSLGVPAVTWLPGFRGGYKHWREWGWRKTSRGE